MKMSIHRGLAEIKMLDKRIERSIQSVLVGSKKKSADNVHNTTLNKDKFVETVKANYQSVNDLIDRRTKIKRLIVLSNATTQVEVGGVTYTVAEAIENKKIIEDKKKLLNQMVTQYNSHMVNVTRQNERVESNLDEQIQVMLGSDKQNKTSSLDGFIEQYKAQNEWELVDGLNIQDEIQKLQTEIEEFESNVDFVLSESNAITTIEIED
jgi:hypothetical protein